MALPPPRWTAAQLETAAAEATEGFRQQRLAESRRTYLEQIERYSRAVEELFADTDDLRDTAGMRTELHSSPERLEAIRYLTGPPISADDLRVIAGTSLSPFRLAAEPDVGRRIIETIVQLLDRHRFPWIEGSRAPTADERAAAVGATSSLLAASRLQTMRRNESRLEQENAVKEKLRAGGLEEVTPRTINSVRDAPDAGQFCGESLFGTRKADIVIGGELHRWLRLIGHDGRLEATATNRWRCPAWHIESASRSASGSRGCAPRARAPGRWRPVWAGTARRCTGSGGAGGYDAAGEAGEGAQAGRRRGPGRGGR